MQQILLFYDTDSNGTRFCPIGLTGLKHACFVNFYLAKIVLQA